MDSLSFFAWKNVSLELKNHNGGKIRLISDASGSIKPGEVMALMGPSGSGKTTLLNILAQRSAYKNATISGDVYTDAFTVTKDNIKLFSSYVEQEDSLIGSLSVYETVDFARKLQDAAKDSLDIGKTDRVKGSPTDRVTEILKHLGLLEQRDVFVGTPLTKGISGGQKRRLSVASQIIGNPSVLFLDEPTSGLDSTAAHQVVTSIKNAAKSFNMMVIISIHQPSTATFNLFDKVLFLAKGCTIYNNRVDKLFDYFEGINKPIPERYNPAEYIIELINTDFHYNDAPSARVSVENEESILNDEEKVLEELKLSWIENVRDAVSFDDSVALIDSSKKINFKCLTFYKCFVAQMTEIGILTHRLFIKSRRDLLAYYVRVVMYLGLAILMGTVWLRLGYHQDDIQPFINAIFFSGAFLSFMTVAYIPSYLEDLRNYRKENMNGLTGPAAFVISNFIVGIPFLFGIVLLFSVITYFMSNFRHSASGFWYFTLWLFLDLVAAESLTVMISTFMPIFVVSLALTAFANGLWMSVSGFLVTTNILNVFWYYTFYWINYQRYVFQGMIFNQFLDTVYDCGSGCHCMYSSDLEDTCKIAGEAVLSNLGYGKENKGLWVGILIVLIFVYRFGTYLALKYMR